ncbi:MAG: acyloxyacyl hydrolase [Carboxylicivirga sp.]|jgi:hypothetical protein|nr:acyloxyacyl hydrolase [Carboxylicivirga sp.]
MKLTHNIYLIVLLLITTQLIKSQSLLKKDKAADHHTYLTTRIHGGVVVPHHANMMYFIEEYSKGFEINYGRSVFSMDSWQSYFNYPEIGIGFYYGTFGNKDIYGSGFALFPYINYKIYRSPKLSIHNKVSMGLGYATKPFNDKENIYNNVFSSHLNAYIGLAILMDYRINERFSLALSTSLTHLSNGAARKPNHGINTLTASLGTKYHFNKALTPVMAKTKAPVSRLQELLIVGSVGRNQSTPYNETLYWNASLSANYLFHLNEKRAVGFGYDQFYSESAPYTWEAYENGNEEISFTSRHYLFNALFCSYNVFLGKTTLFLNLGAYLHTNIKPPQAIYPRLGIRHQITNKIVANFSLKASFFRSEFMEFGLGYRIENPFKR